MISAIVVNYNNIKYLPKCLASLRSSSLVSEILLVDNASDDRSVAVVQERFADVKILAQKENLGFAAANNLAAGAATGDQLLLLNADAWVAGDAVKALVTKLAGQEGIGLVAPRLIYPNGSPQFCWSPDRSIVGECVQKLRNLAEEWRLTHNWGDPLLQKMFAGGWYSAACWLVRKSAFDQVGGFDRRFFLYFEDVDFCIRLRQAGWRLAAESAAVVVHVGGGSSPRNRAEIAYRKSQLLFYREHRPPGELRLLKMYLRAKYGRLRSQSSLCAEIYAIVDSFDD